MYAVTVTATKKNEEGWTTTRFSPTFYLDENVQGIRSEEHARAVVKDLARSLWSDADLMITAVKVS